jgi:alpha-glucosidase
MRQKLQDWMAATSDPLLKGPIMIAPSAMRDRRRLSVWSTANSSEANERIGVEFMQRFLKPAVGMVVFTCLFSSLLSALTPSTSTISSLANSESYKPVASQDAMVELGRVRFTVLTSRLIRMEWAADGKFEDHASLVFLNRRLPVPSFKKSIQHEAGIDVLRIDTAELHLIYRATLQDAGRFTSTNLEIHFTLKGNAVTWKPGMADTGNLLGTTRTLDRAFGSKTPEPIEPGLISRDGWVLVDDSARQLFDSTDFSFPRGENSPWPWVLQRPAGEHDDWYFFGYGHEYKEALGDYVKVAGRIPLPPYFAFGAWWSRYWAYSDQGFNRLVTGFHDNETPLDVLVIDMDWHPTGRQILIKGKVDQSGQRLGWTGFSWNKLLFPDPQAFLAKVHREGLHVALNLHPASGVQPWETRYPEMARAMGIDPATGKYVPLEITDRKFVVNYMNILLHPLEKEGVNFWWLDWQQGSVTRIPGLNPTWWLNYVHFTDQVREGKRPLLFGRWGGLGNHRYQIGFSGDVISAWDSLAFQPWFTATAANVGYAYWSHDIGGHIPGVDSPELYTRWVQFGVFSPILRTHSSYDGQAERRIWAYPEPYSDVMRDAFRLRYQLTPYIYTEARRTYDTGVAFMRELYYDWPEADPAYTSRNEYMFGDQMLAAPVTSAADPSTRLATESIWLPSGNWIEWDTGRHLTGPIHLSRKVSIDQIPIYVHAGAIIPMAPPMDYTTQKPVDPLSLTVFPLNPGQHSDYRLYQDAGDTRSYQQGQAEWTSIHAEQNGEDLTVTIGPASGDYPGMHNRRRYTLRLPGDWPPESVMVNGQSLTYSTHSDKPGWWFEGNTLTTIISIGTMSVGERVVVRVCRSARLMQERTELDGFAGIITRLRDAEDMMAATVPVGLPPDELVDAAQTGDRLSFRPDTAEQELGGFRAKLQSAYEQIKQMKDLGEAAQRQLDRQAAGPNANADPWLTVLNSQQTADYAGRFAQVSALLADAIGGNPSP